MANTERHLLRKEAGVKRWSADTEMLFGGKAAAPICQLHTEAKVRSFKTSSLPVKKKKRSNTDFSSAIAQQQLYPTTSLLSICLRTHLQYLQEA